ncbi:MAG: thioesterase family protein [Candidatus Methylomirabilia bacterium]
MGNLTTGMTHTIELAVTQEMTADAHGNPGVKVLASPELLALFEGAAIKAMTPGLDQGQGSVGTNFAFQHLAPTPVGMRVRVTATLTQTDGKRATFRIEASDEKEAIAAGEHERVVVDMGRFLGRIAKKAGA